MGLLCGGMVLLTVVYVVFMRTPAFKKQPKTENSISLDETEKKGVIFTVTSQNEEVALDRSLTPNSATVKNVEEPDSIHL